MNLHLFCYLAEKKYLFLIIFCIILLSLPIHSFSQINSESNDSIKSIVKTDSIVLQSMSHFDCYDKEENEILNYFLKDLPFFVYRYIPNNSLYLSNGLIASPRKSFIFYPDREHDFFDLYKNFSHLIVNLFDDNFHISNTPISNAYYSMGAKNEQLFQIFHIQPIDTNTNISLRYTLLSSPGVFQHQKSDFSSFHTNLSYISPKKNYSTLFSLSLNKVKLNENGGLLNTDEFENNENTDKQFMTTKLLTAENRLKNNQFLLHQTLKLFKLHNTPLYAGYLGGYSNMKKVFEDATPDSMYYSKFNINEKNLYDSLFTQLISNIIYFSNYTNYAETDNKIKAQLGLKHEYIKSQFCDIKHNSNDLEVFASLVYEIDSLWEISSDLAYKFYEDSEIDISINVTKLFDNDYVKSLSFITEFFNQDPHFYYYNYKSNYHIWHNEFNIEKVFTINGGLSTKFGDIYLGGYKINNYAYYSNTITPAQYDGNLNVLSTSYTFKKDINNLFVNLNVGLQLVDKKDILHLPKYYGQLQTAYRFPMFKKAMDMCVGIETFWFYKYYADIWSPIILQFHNQKETQIGNYIYPNIFVAVNIQKARLFVMLENITEGLTKNNFYAMPSYPRSGRVVRWGVSWTFIN